jgi:hypothetical protein
MQTPQTVRSANSTILLDDEESAKTSPSVKKIEQKPEQKVDVKPPKDHTNEWKHERYSVSVIK